MYTSDSWFNDEHSLHNPNEATASVLPRTGNLFYGLEIGYQGYEYTRAEKAVDRAWDAS